MITNEHIAAYTDAIIADFGRFQSQCKNSPSNRTPDARYAELMTNFRAGLQVRPGKKYIKIVSRNSAHSFIVVEPTGKFKSGDILKAAGWAVPAKNFARGNVIERKYEQIQWTGA